MSRAASRRTSPSAPHATAARCALPRRSLFAVPAALLGPASPAAADLGAPNRASVPAQIPSSEAHALPADSTNVRIAMTENDGLDVIVAASLGRRVGAGRARLARRAVPARRAGTWDVDTGPGCAGPWTPVPTNQTTPTASPVSGGPPAAVRRERQPDRARHVDGGLQLGRSGEDGQHAAARDLRRRHGARGVTVELGQPGRGRSPGHGLGLPGARGPGRRRPFLCARRPRRLRRLRRHL